MVKYDYSLDVGQSIKTDEKLKKEQPESCCPAQQPEEKKTGDEEPIEEEAVQDTEEPAEEPKEEKEQEEKVEIKPVSFEKAKLISDYAEQDEKKPEEQKEIPAKIPEKTPEEEIPEINRAEEDEEDVNEFLEDSFKKETQEREAYNNNKIKKTPPKSKKWIWALLAIILIISAGWYGYSQLKTPTSAAAAEINITPIITAKNITPEPAVETKPANISVDNALEQLTNSLKD